MKKKSLKLSDLKVQSFVTALNGMEAATIKGGSNTDNPVCMTAVAACQKTNAEPHCGIVIPPDTGPIHCVTLQIECA